MHLDALRDVCLAQRGAYEDTPFGPDTLVFKVEGKMFGIVGLEAVEPAVGLKCDPERAVDLRERYGGIHAGPYLNKRHWNYVDLRSDVPEALVRDLVAHSYALVVAGLPRAARQRLAGGA